MATSSCSSSRSDSPKNITTSAKQEPQSSGESTGAATTTLLSSITLSYYNDDQWTKSSKYFSEIENLYILGKNYPKPIGMSIRPFSQDYLIILY